MNRITSVTSLRIKKRKPLSNVIANRLLHRLLKTHGDEAISQLEPWLSLLRLPRRKQINFTKKCSANAPRNDGSNEAISLLELPEFHYKIPAAQIKSVK
jgi:hypothetical protein